MDAIFMSIPMVVVGIGIGCGLGAFCMRSKLETNSEILTNSDILTWQQVLYPHNRSIQFPDLRQYAEDLGYDYFWWYNGIYSALSGSFISTDEEMGVVPKSST